MSMKSRLFQSQISTQAYIISFDFILGQLDVRESREALA